MPPGNSTLSITAAEACSRSWRRKVRRRRTSDPNFEPAYWLDIFGSGVGAGRPPRQPPARRRYAYYSGSPLLEVIGPRAIPRDRPVTLPFPVQLPAPLTPANFPVPPTIDHLLFPD